MNEWRVEDIRWDVTDDGTVVEVSLPSSVIVEMDERLEVEAEDVIEDVINAVSDEYGFLIESANVSRIN